LVDGKLPRARRALLADALGTTAGAVLGTSTITSDVERAAGVAEGGRTGLTALVVAGLFGLALFVSPVVQVVGGGVETAAGRLYPTVAPALVVVGCLMLQPVSKVAWDDWTEGFPAFLTLVMMPFTFSITRHRLASGLWCSPSPGGAGSIRGSRGALPAARRVPGRRMGSLPIGRRRKPCRRPSDCRRSWIGPLP
jgi:xanthine/uracil/vitamin C permease (AzgA family)